MHPLLGIYSCTTVVIAKSHRHVYQPIHDVSFTAVWPAVIASLALATSSEEAWVLSCSYKSLLASCVENEEKKTGNYRHTNCSSSLLTASLIFWFKPGNTALVWSRACFYNCCQHELSRNQNRYIAYLIRAVSECTRHSRRPHPRRLRALRYELLAARAPCGSWSPP